MDNGASSYRRFRDNGDESGLAEVIRGYKDGLIFYLNSFVGNIHMAEELAEDTFVLLGTKKPRDKGGSCFRTWLYAIGRNVAIDRLRQQKRSKTLSLEECPELTDEEKDLENAYIKQEQKILLHRAMGKLKLEYRQILWLLYFEDFSHKQAAQVMKKSVHSTETLAYRARQSLKLQLEKEGFIYENL